MYLGDIDKGSQPILTPSSDDTIPDDKDHTPGSSMPYRDNYEDDKFDSESEVGNEVVDDDQVGLILCSVIRWEEAVPSYSLPAPSRHS